MIGIVGNGFVGNAVYQNFRDKEITKVYDVDKIGHLTLWKRYWSVTIFLYVFRHQCDLVVNVICLS